MRFDYDLIVIGSGSAGFVAAVEAARLGFRVLIVEKDKIGGECTNTGCVPSKTLIKAAKIVHNVKRSPEYGLPQYRGDKVNLAQVMEHVRQIVSIFQSGELQKCKTENIAAEFGFASFLDPNRIRVNDRETSSRFFLIATGSSPAIPEIQGLEEAGFVTNQTLFEMKELPETLIVIGGGPIAMEMAQAFGRLGSRVIVLQRSPRVLPKEDEALSLELARLLQREGIQIYTDASISKIEKSGNRKRFSFKSGAQSLSMEGDEILVAAGRVPNVSGLNLENLGVEIGDDGIRVDPHLRTAVKKIYACGDCIGPYLFTHAAGYQAKIAVYHALAGLPVSVNYRVMPWATFTDPELARVGLTENEARTLPGKDVQVHEFPFQNVDRAITDGETAGRIKVVTDKKGQILGAHILGPNAGELIHEFVLAMEHGITLDQIARTIHVYPTLSLGLWQSTEARLQQSLNDSLLIKLFRLFAAKPGQGEY